MRLIGEDQGPDATSWIKWWQQHKATFEVPKQVPKLPEIAEKAWSDDWDPKPAAEPAK